MRKPERPIRLIFVCLGNICRSPMAEHVFRSRVDALGISQHFEIKSAGTSADTGTWTTDKRTLDTLLHHGITAKSQFAHQVKAYEMEYYDYIVGMDGGNRSKLLALAGENHELRAKVISWRKFDQINPNGDVPDPFYGVMHDFEVAYDIIERNTDPMIKWMLEQGPKSHS